MAMEGDEATHVGTVDGWRPPECEPTVRDLIETRPLGVGQLLVFHRFLKSGCFLPEQTLPGREVGATEERVLQYALHATQRLDHVCAVVVQIPEFAVVPLMGPPEWVLFQHLSNTITTLRLETSTEGRRFP